MVYYKTGKGKGQKKYGGSIGIGPVKITSAKPSLRNQVKNVAKSVKEIQNKEELKYVDTFLNGTALTSTATLTLLNGMTLGDNESSRDGTELSSTSVQFRGSLTQADTGTDSELIARHIIFWDSQANGSAPSSGDVLDGAVISNLVFAPYKRQYQKRFKILHDKVMITKPKMADPTAAATQVLSPRNYFKEKIPLGRVVKYRNAQNTGVITDIASNSLYSLWVSTAGGTNQTVVCGYRFYFKDD